MVSWQIGFTNVPADAVIAELKALGFAVTEGDTLL